ncbi:unnamed protein product [Hyaloperonospora brassicae]|uniref:RxLR effector protein n=1 Tax=Hyaloperonospora brassicae TaxID=162125 RepID=A0AAV0SY61_HYABA|nr:unnamed protein product [Hyaloperonospora brassicae]
MRSHYRALLALAVLFVDINTALALAQTESTKVTSLDSRLPDRLHATKDDSDVSRQRFLRTRDANAQRMEERGNFGAAVVEKAEWAGRILKYTGWLTAGKHPDWVKDAHPEHWVGYYRFWAKAHVNDL